MMRLLALLTLPLAATMAAISAPRHVLLGSVTQASTVNVVATWPAAADARGSADSYVVRWTYYATIGASPGVLTRTLSRTTDTLLAVPLPVWPDSTPVRVTVFSKRRNLISADSVTTLRWFKRDEGLPPAPTSVTLDTLSTS